VKKFQLVQEGGADRWDILLGVFPTEDEALTLLSELKKIGVRSAKQGTQVSAPARYHLRVNGPQTVLQVVQKLPGLGAPSECAANPTATPPAASMAPHS